MATTHASERLYMKWKDTKDPMASTSLGGLGRRGGANLQRRKETTTTTITTTTTTTTRSVSVSSSTKTNKTKARHVPGEYSPASPQVIALSIGKSEAERIRESVQYIRHKKSRRRGARRARYDDDDDDEDEDDSDDTSSSSRDSSEEEGSEVGNGDGESAGEDEKEGSNALKVTKSNGNSFDENRAPRRHRRRHRHRRVAGNEKDDAEEYESDPYMLITILVVWSLIVYYLLQTQYIGRLLIEVARPLIILATVRSCQSRASFDRLVCVCVRLPAIEAKTGGGDVRMSRALFDDTYSDAVDICGASN